MVTQFRHRPGLNNFPIKFHLNTEHKILHWIQDNFLQKKRKMKTNIFPIKFSNSENGSVASWENVSIPPFLHLRHDPWWMSFGSLAFFCCLFHVGVSYCRKYSRFAVFFCCSFEPNFSLPLLLWCFFVPLVLQEANKYFSWEINCNKLYRIEIKMKILLYMFFHFAARMEEKLKYKNEKGRGGFFSQERCQLLYFSHWY